MSLHIMIMVDGVNKYTKLMTISFLDCKKYYKELPHQVEAVTYLGEILLKTPARARLGLSTPVSWINISDEHLIWLQRQISPKTINKFASLWRADKRAPINKHINYFSQRDNKINWAISCNSSSHSMYTDFILRKFGKPGLNTDDEFVRRVYSGKYGKYSRNNSASWDIVHRVCRSFGVYCKYSNRGKLALIQEIKRNGISCTNIYHKGTGRRTRAGGHVICVVDYDKDKGFLFYDPWGSKPSNGYINKTQGVYWMTNNEFSWRHQGIHTEFVKLV